MSWSMSTRRLALLSTLAVAVPMPPAQAQTGPAAADVDNAAVTETIQVTATRIPEDVEPVPASVTVISGDELRARGVTDLPSALALVAGVAIAPGGDAGPAGSVPEIWGLREFDAFLLVVDGVPWGGAFNPALATLDLTDVERIEILRGAAPGALRRHLVRRRHPGHPPRRRARAGGSAERWGGNYSSGGAAVSLAPARPARSSQSLTVDGEKQGFKDDRTEYRARPRALPRRDEHGRRRSFRLDFDGTVVRPGPGEPARRARARCSPPPIPLDANYNPSDAHQRPGPLPPRRAATTARWGRRQLPGRPRSRVTHTAHDTRARLPHRGRRTRSQRQRLRAGPDDRRHLLRHPPRLHPTSAFQVIAGFDHLYGRRRRSPRTSTTSSP